MPPTSPVETIRQTTPLTKKPPTGVTVATVIPTTPQATYYVETLEEAAAALGWSIKTYTYEPEGDPGPPLMQAINSNPDYVWAYALVPESLKTQFAAAEKAGIPVLNEGNPGPSDPAKGYYSLNRSPSEYATAGADWVMNDAKGDAHVLMVNLPVYPYLQEFSAMFEERVNKYCPECTYEVLNVTIEDFSSGQIPTKITSFLQAHPDINYVYIANTDLVQGVVPALRSTGLLEHITLTATGTNKAVAQAIGEGYMRGNPITASAAIGWQALDVAARLSVGMDLSKVINTKTFAYSPVESWNLVEEELAKELEQYEYGWPGPENFQEQYEALWQIGS